MKVTNYTTYIHRGEQISISNPKQKRLSRQMTFLKKWFSSFKVLKKQVFKKNFKPIHRILNDLQY